MSPILAAILSGPLCVKATPMIELQISYAFITLHSEAHDLLFYYGCCEHTRDWYGSLQGRFPHNGLFTLLLCIYYDLCLASCTFTVNKLLLLLTQSQLNTFMASQLVKISTYIQYHHNNPCLSPMFTIFVSLRAHLAHNNTLVTYMCNIHNTLVPPPPPPPPTHTYIYIYIYSLYIFLHLGFQTQQYRILYRAIGIIYRTPKFKITFWWYNHSFSWKTETHFPTWSKLGNSFIKKVSYLAFPIPSPSVRQLTYFGELHRFTKRTNLFIVSRLLTACDSFY